MTDTATADTPAVDHGPDNAFILARLAARLARLERAAAVKEAVEQAAKLPPPIPVMKLPPPEPTTWTGREYACFDRMVAMAAMGTEFAYDPGTHTLRLHNPLRPVDPGHVASLSQFKTALAAIFAGGIPSEIISGVARSMSMSTVPAALKAGCTHLIRAGFAPDLLKAWDAVQVFGLGPPDSPIKSLAEAIGSTHYVVGWHRDDSRHIVRNTVVIRSKVTGEETTWRRPEPSAYARHRLAWAANDSVIQLPAEADDGLPAA